MLAWEACETQLAQFLSNISEGRTIKQTGVKIGKLYLQAVRAAIPKRVPGFSVLPSPFLGLRSSPVEQGFIEVFEKFAKLKTDKKPTPLDWMPAANGVVKFWTAKQLNIATPPPTTPWLDIPPEFGSPPPPPAAPIPIHTPPMISHMVTVPGTPMPLNTELWKAWNMKKPKLVAREAVIAFQNHAKLIQGIALWSNPVPPVAPPVPTPFPWVGIQ